MSRALTGGNFAQPTEDNWPKLLLMYICKYVCICMYMYTPGIPKVFGIRGPMGCLSSTVGRALGGRQIILEQELDLADLRAWSLLHCNRILDFWISAHMAAS